MPSLVYYIDVGVKSPNYDAYGLFRALHSHWHHICFLTTKKSELSFTLASIYYVTVYSKAPVFCKIKGFPIFYKGFFYF